MAQKSSVILESQTVTRTENEGGWVGRGREQDLCHRSQKSWHSDSRLYCLINTPSMSLHVYVFNITFSTFKLQCFLILWCLSIGIVASLSCIRLFELFECRSIALPHPPPPHWILVQLLEFVRKVLHTSQQKVEVLRCCLYSH